ncbi:MAG: N-acetyltransferase [Deltaproteobacteria bacterium]|nr:N-acetyltransferase [Deltaproteobacteria bacterium]
MPVGRIAAIINRTHNDWYGDKVGFFGFFDCCEDPSIASALFERARSELQVRKCDRLRGPYNPTVNDECGLLVDGFEYPPLVMMPYNPPYYMKLYEGLGLQPVKDLYAFYVPAANEAPERVRKIVERVKRTTGITLRTVNKKKLKEELLIIQELFNLSWKDNWGFVPLSREDLEFAAGDLKAIIDPNLVMFAEKDGVPVGFSVTIPDINEFMLRVKRSSSWLRVLRFIWSMKTSHPSQARLALLGVRPDFRNTGIAALFYYETLMRGKRKYVGGELSWVLEDNHVLTKSIEVMGGRRYKTYRIFEAAL